MIANEDSQMDLLFQLEDLSAQSRLLNVQSGSTIANLQKAMTKAAGQGLRRITVR